MKKLLTYLSVMLLFAAYSCHTETDIQVSSMLKDGICINSTVVKMQLSNMIEGDQDTKSVVEIDAVEAFQNAMLFCMNPGQNGTIDNSDLIWKNGENEGYYHYTEERVINWPLPWDSNGAAPFVIYVLVNVGNYDEELVSSLETKATNGTLTVGDLKNIVYESPSIMSFKTIETENKGLPQAGVSDKITLTTEVQTETINVYAKCLYAKYEFWLRTESLVDAGYTELQGKYAYANTNTKVYPFIENYSVPHTSEGLEQMMIQDLATAEDIAALENWTAGNAICLYVLENCQGTDNSNTRWYNQSSITNKEYKNSIAFGIKGKDPEGKYFESDYAVYLGTGNNACVKDFNVVRNWHGTLRISITPDLVIDSQYGIKFTPASAIQVAPGESVTVPFETSESDINNIDFSIYEQDGTTIANGISISASNLALKGSGSYQYSKLLYSGTVTLTAQADANEGTYSISADISTEIDEYYDSAGILITEHPVIKAWEANFYPVKYVGQWAGFEYDSTMNAYDMTIKVNTRYDDTDHISSLTILHGSQDDRDYHLNSTSATQNNINLHQVYFNGSSGFNYGAIYHMPAPKGKTGEYYLTIEFYNPSNGQKVASKEYNLNLLTPYTKVEFIKARSYYKNLHELSYDNSTKTGVYSFGLFGSDSYLSLNYYDPTNDEEIPRNFFVYGYSQDTGVPDLSSDSNYWLEEAFLSNSFTIEDEAQNYAYWVQRLGTPGAMNAWIQSGNIQLDHNGVMTSEAESIDNDCYFTVTHSLFPGENKFYVYDVEDTAQRGINIYYGKGASPSQMQIGEKKESGPTYLMYGFTQTYFIKMEGLSGEPEITVSIPSTQAPYLKYQLNTTQDANIYQLNLWVNQYEDPLSYNPSAKPYSAITTDGYDESSGDKTVSITFRKYCDENGITYTQNLAVKVLHKRFELVLGNSENDENLKIHMWNPLGLTFSTTVSAEYTQTQYTGGDIVWTGFPWLMNASTSGGILFQDRDEYSYKKDWLGDAAMWLFVGRNMIGKSSSPQIKDYTTTDTRLLTCNPSPSGYLTTTKFNIKIGNGYQIMDLPDLSQSYDLPLWDSANNMSYGSDWRNYDHVWVILRNKLKDIKVSFGNFKYISGAPGLTFNDNNGSNIRRYFSVPANSFDYGTLYTDNDNRFYKVYLSFVETYTNVPLIGGAILLANAGKTDWIAKKYEKNPIVWFADPVRLIQEGRTTPSSVDMTITNGVGTLEELIRNGWQFGPAKKFYYTWKFVPINSSANINN